LSLGVSPLPFGSQMPLLGRLDGVFSPLAAREGLGNHCRMLADLIPEIIVAICHPAGSRKVNAAFKLTGRSRKCSKLFKKNDLHA